MKAVPIILNVKQSLCPLEKYSQDGKARPSSETKCTVVMGNGLLRYSKYTLPEVIFRLRLPDVRLLNWVVFELIPVAHRLRSPSSKWYWDSTTGCETSCNNGREQVSFFLRVAWLTVKYSLAIRPDATDGFRRNLPEQFTAGFHMQSQLSDKISRHIYIELLGIHDHFQRHGRRATDRLNSARDKVIWSPHPPNT